ncbi:MAG: hypothetical protein ACOC5D_04995, partial [Thermoplasmatota archaeon]
MSIFSRLAQKYSPDKDDDPNKEVSDLSKKESTTDESQAGNVFSRIAQNKIKKDNESEVKKSLTKRSISKPFESRTGLSSRQTKSKTKKRRKEEPFMTIARELDKQDAPISDIQSTLFDEPERDRNVVEPIEPNEDRLKSVLDAAQSKEDVNLIRKALKPTTAGESDQVIAQVEKREDQMDDIDKMIHQKELELNKETKRDKPKEGLVMEAAPEEDVEGILGNIKKGAKDSKDKVKDFLRENIRSLPTEREAPQRFKDPETGDIITREGLVPEKNINWVRLPFQSKEDATPIKTGGLDGLE